jgi:hypothetical protein
MLLKKKKKKELKSFKAIFQILHQKKDEIGIELDIKKNYIH